MVNDDIILAQNVVGLSGTNMVSDQIFHSTSGIYIKSNERIESYQKYLENRERILSVIASGDQILNCILGGTKFIDAFDISVFPKFFLALKMAALQGLTREEYIKFFYGNIRPEKEFEDMYDRIRIFLGGNNLSFWDSLFDYFEWYDIYNSTLFSSEPIITEHAIRQNKYLDKVYYQRMKELVTRVKINTFDGNILDIYSSFKGSYDLVYLSNIIYYSDLYEYRDLLDKFNLTDQGIILTYFYEVSKGVINLFNHERIKIEKIEDSTCALMLYHK